ncbi:methyltransferase domain-containing protein [Xanthobacter aminoxidans]|uniref:methyltransferase domain-containing protein n=1 Tax=Xanthobacter aminoxidans TaxID=186280 RepID=UPI0037264DA9
MALNVVEKLFRADTSRPTRFHTAKGKLVLSPDILKSLATTINRIIFDRYADVPWLPYPAIAHIETLIKGKTLLEFGSGTSTQWYADRCKKIVSIENSPKWHAFNKNKLSSRPNVEYILADSDDEMIFAADKIDQPIDVFVIDCLPGAGSRFPGSDPLRVACLRSCIQVAKPGAIFIIDNTDAMKDLNSEVEAQFQGSQVKRISGWAPGIMHPNETTVVEHYQPR